MSISITTSDYLEEKHILVDGNDWIIKLPGAGSELRLSQSNRRMKLLDKKIEDGTATEADFDLYDKLENNTIDMFKNMLNDQTTDNKSVIDWIENTPLAVINASFEEIKKQAEDNKKSEIVDGKES